MIKKGGKPFIIAELSGNHGGNLDRALEMVDLAAKSKVSAVKIQTYTADTMTLPIEKPPFLIEEESSLWRGRTLYDLYEEAHTPWDWHKAIFDRCRERGVLGFSTPFDFSAVDFLEDLNVPAYKIASFENTDIALIRYVAKTKKPMIISTGMATEEEIGEAVSAAREAGTEDVVLLKCTSAYPAPESQANIATMVDMEKKFNCHVGLSDHTLGLGVAIAAIAQGATVVEKHFTDDRSKKTVDSEFSLEPHEFELLVKEGARAAVCIGSISYGPTEKEKPSLRYRRSLYVSQDISAGSELSAENIKPVRPSGGLPTKYYEDILGKKIVCNKTAGDPLVAEDIEGGIK